MDDAKKRTLLMAALFLVVGLGYFAVTELFGSETPATPPAAQETERPARPERPQKRAPRQTPEQRAALARTGRIEGLRFEATVDNLGGGLSSFRVLDDERFTVEGRPLDVITTDPAREQYRSLRTTFARLGLPDDLVWELEQVSEREVRLRWEGRGLRIVRSLRAGNGPYQVWHTIRVTNTGTRARTTRPEVAVFHYVRHEDESGGGFFGFLGAHSPAISQGTCAYGEDEMERVDRGRLAPDEAPAGIPHGYGGGRRSPDVHFAAVENVYFVQAVASHGEPAARCRLFASQRGRPTVEGTLFESRLAYPWETIEPGQERTWRSLAYLGPKIPSSLHAAGHRLPKVVDLGFFEIIAGQLANLLSFIQDYVGNWGVAIILLTLLIRLVLFPLTNLSFNSMARMRQLKPEIDRINQLYADNAERKGAAVMELYRKHKINPLSGCLPMLLQLPIWWALYTSLSTNIELYHMPFVYPWTDLSAPDPYFALPLALGALMHVQQRITPTTMDPAQAKMMLWFMPIMITVFMLFLPSGLCLYMLTNSALGIGQQKLNEWRIARAEPIAPIAPSPPDDAPDDAGGADETSSPNEPVRRPKRKRQRRPRRGRA